MIKIEEQVLEEVVCQLKDKNNLRYGCAVVAAFGQNLSESPYNIIPSEFISLVENINGIVGDCGVIFGLNCDCGYGFEDVIDVNTKLNRPDRDKVVVLGRNNFDLLVYNSANSGYEMRDRSNDCVRHRFVTLVEVLRFMYRV